ncbi:MAG TPA: amino acid adenylation domain-containing protein [Pyrinomonadaceae bacterium]
MNDYSKTIAELSPEKRELLEMLMQEEAGEPDSFPLSFAQQRLWFIDRLEPNSFLYNISTNVRLEGRLNVPALARSFAEIVRRHEVLRTTFRLEGRAPVQVINESATITPTVVNLEAVPTAEREEEVRRLLREESRRPFDLAQGPLLRVKLLRISDEEHVLLLTMHHIISDGWSLGVLVREMAALYRAYSGGAESPLAELPIQYADFVLWQQETLEGETLESHLRYWREQLAGAPAVLELPTDRPRPAVNTNRGAKLSFALPSDLSAAVKEFSEREGATLYMTLLAAFQTLLHRYARQEEIVVGTPIANRNRAETEALIGFFINTLVLRTDFAGDPTFRELLGRVREVALGAYAHQDLPFEKLVEELQPERSLSHTPLFQVVFVLQNAPLGSLELPGLKLTPVGGDNGTAKFDLTLTLEESGRGLVGGIEYNTDLFDAETAGRMLRHYENLLRGAVAAPERRVSELPLLTESELNVVTERNPTDVVFPTEGTLHERFAAQAARVPGAVALTFDGTHVTYGELNRQSNQLAHRLRRLGVGAESRVGVMLERSPRMLVALLGILKAGGAYVPLDPHYPQERLSFMLADAEVAALLTESDLPFAPPTDEVLTIRLDADWADIATESEENPVSVARPENLAYIIYTSGSTGKPKGVTVTHGNVLRLFTATDHWFNFDERDVWTLFHSYAFDFSVWELWGALLYGGRLVIVPYIVSRSPEAFHQLLVDERVTVLNQTPSAFRQLMQAEEGAGGGEMSLRLVIFGGEALELQSLRPWFERHGDERPLLVNMYGITETTVHVTYRPVSMVDVEAGAGSVIGVPIPDLQSYVLDAHMRPVPDGVAGELYVGGGGVARGYLRRPGLTATRFVPHPFTTRPGARLYRTGDLARYTRDGDLEYLGRIDHQVKIRGFRIELGEIEAVLSAHPLVREAIVLAREDAPGEKRLVAYLVADPGAAPAAGELRGFLRERLPDYMVPSAFVTLDKLPLTNHGKVNRQALPLPDSARPELERAYVAPSTSVEETLAGVWAEVLGVEQVGIHDNFFELGGDSIRSVGLLALAKERGLDFSLQQLFQHQTVYELAREIEAADAAGRAQVTPDTRTEPFELLAEDDLLKLPDGLEDAYPLTMMQAGMLFHSEYSPESSVYHNVTSFRLRARFDEEALRSALRRVINRHPVLRTSFDLTSYGEPLQLVHREVELPMRVEDLRLLPPAERKAALAASFEAEKEHKFDWRRAPLVRLLVQRDCEESFQITLTEHHAILDGWSVALLFSEMFGHYLSLLGGGAEPQPSPLSSSFRDFVRLEQSAVGSEESRRFWQELLSDSVVTTIPSLPGTAGADGVKQLRAVEVAISRETSDGLKSLAQSTGVPLKSVLLAAHLRVMSLVGGQADVLTGVISHGRPEGADGARVAGLFLNTLPFRLRLSGGTWAELVEETFAAELEMLPHRRYPLAQIQNEHGHSLLETFFNFINFHVYEELASSGLVETTDTRQFSDTNFPFSIEFSLDPRTADITLILSSGETSDLTGEQLEAIGGYYANALKGMSADPFARYETQSLLAPAEREQLLEGWNQTRADYPSDLLIHQLFETQAALTPNATALVGGPHRLTYDQLNVGANRLAHRLRALGVGPESRVGVMLSRSPSVLVSLLAVLKSGGAYVPLDPAYPRDRLAFMLDDARVKVLLTESALLTLVPEGEAQVICLDSHSDGLNIGGDENPASVTLPENLAYVIYTSGSTGRPKGVAIAHRSAVAFLDWARGFFSEEELSAVLAATSINFDLSVFELFAPLAVGGTVLLADNALALPALEYAGEVKLINTVPSAMAELVRQGAVPSSVTTVNLAGEALPRRLAQAIYESSGVARLVNLYGPSEDTTYTTWEVVEDAPSAPVLIGRPVANTRIYILDGSLQPTPVGVAGELYTTGAGLARGYLNRPALTAEKFIPDSFSAEPGGRMYRTGDVARFLADGRIEYLGRADHQVKVRGFRIELGEIEAALERYEGVERAVVMVREGEGGDKRLVAYVVAKDGREVTAWELRGTLKAGLPEYMVPQAFVLLDELPLTPNGKVDRKRLPEPEAAGGSEGEYAAPRTQVEEVLANVWAEVLGLERVGVEDNFFELGGQSILATQVITRAREALQVEIPLRSLFNAPTPAGLAEVVEAMLREKEGGQLPPLERAPRDGELPLSFAQQRLWFLDQWNQGSADFNITEAVRLNGRLDVLALGRTFDEIVRRHEVLRTTFPSVEGRAAQFIAPSMRLPLPVVDLGGLPEAEREALRLAREEARTPFDLSQGPLVRVTLMRLSDEEHMLLFNMHHIISDGWSLGVLIDEVVALYGAFSRGEASTLPELPIQYADFASWQQSWLQGPALAAQLDYWRQQLSGAPPLLELPLDRPRPARQTFDSAKVPVEISAELTEALKSLSRRTGSTLFMTLLAAYNVMLRHHTGADDIVVGTDVANRNRFEVEKLIGFFINQLVLRTRLSDDTSFEALLGRVRETTLGAYAHQDMPFDRLVEGLKVERSLQHSPLFQVKFVLQNAPAPDLELPDLAAEVVGINSGKTGVDLQLTLTEVGGALRGWLEYNSRLFDAATVARLAGDFMLLLETAASRPSATLSELGQLLGGGAAHARPSEAKESVSQKLKAGRRKAVNAAPTR